MTKRVAWVDEDDRIWAPERQLLLGLGCSVECFGDASTALDSFYTGGWSEFSFFVLDVMLLQGENDKLFSNAETKNGRDTGLVLARAMVQRDATAGRKIVFFSRASNPEHVKLIENTARQIGAKYLRKTPQNSRAGFIAFLQRHGFIE